jgi:opacity protein-like surface antigen
MSKYTLSFVAVILALAGTAQAQAKRPLSHKKWEVSVFAGGSFIGEGTYPTPVIGSSQETSRTVGLRYASGSQFGFRITENRGHHWGGSAEYSFSNQPLTFTNLSDSVPSLSLSHSVHRFAYDVLYYPTESSVRLRPYVFAGSGVSLFYVGGSSKEAAAARGVHLSDPWKFTYHWGGGLKYLVADGVAVGFQFSDGVSDVPSYGLPPTSVSGSQAVAGFRPDGYLNNWLVSLGFVYQWDRW